MRRQAFWIAYILLLIAQLLLSNYCQFTPYVMVSILPVMILCIPTRVNRFWVLVIAFASGLLVDWLTEGLLGLNALALVPVAYFRDGIIRLIFGEELFSRNESFSVSNDGVFPIAMAILLAQALFLAIYVWVDSAGTREFLFNLYRFLASLGAGVLVSLLTLNALASDARR